MHSLTYKLILAFLTVSLIQSGLMAFLARETAQQESEYFIVEQASTRFIENMSAHYLAVGSWEGVARTWPRDNEPGRQAGAKRVRPYALADQNGIIVFPAGRYEPGYRLTTEEQASGTPLTVDSEVVGTVIRNEESYQLSGRELAYLERILQTILRAAVIGLTIALLLGVFLAQGFTKPLRWLTKAAQALARGDEVEPVPVRSRDEIGTLAKTFNQMSADLQEANALRRRMTADIAHDVRTPLTVITGYLEAFRDGDLQPSQEQFDTMFAQAQHLGRLVEDLRTLSLADAGELPLFPQKLALKGLLERIGSGFEQQMREKNLQLNINVEPSLPDLRVDPDRITQVLSNLVINALRHTPAGGQITLEARMQADRVILQVIDTGSGIPPEALPHIFERFYRVGTSRHRTHGESGLGLAIVRSIVEAHGGKIEVESELGQGTIFTIVLPGEAS